MGGHGIKFNKTPKDVIACFTVAYEGSEETLSMREVARKELFKMKGRIEKTKIRA